MPAVLPSLGTERRLRGSGIFILQLTTLGCNRQLALRADDASEYREIAEPSAAQAREETPPASTHLEHEFAAEVARLAQPVRVSSIGQAIKLDLRHAYGARLKQFDDALERAGGRARPAA